MRYDYKNVIFHVWCDNFFSDISTMIKESFNLNNKHLNHARQHWKELKKGIVDKKKRAALKQKQWSDVKWTTRHYIVWKLQAMQW